MSNHQETHDPGCASEAFDACDCRGTPAPAHWGRVVVDEAERVRLRLRRDENAKRARASRRKRAQVAA